MLTLLLLAEGINEFATVTVANVLLNWGREFSSSSCGYKNEHARLIKL